MPEPKVYLPRLHFKESPNQSERVHGPDAIRLIIVHTPEGGYEGTINYITSKTNPRKVSYHVLISEDGKEATQMVPWNRKAWHAGAYNSLSEGVSAAGYARNFNVRSEQFKRLARVVAFRLHERKLPARWARDGGGSGFCRHADLQTDRSDPMSLPKWLTFVARVKLEHRRGKYRKTWGRD